MEHQVGKDDSSFFWKFSNSMDYDHQVPCQMKSTPVPGESKTTAFRQLLKRLGVKLSWGRKSRQTVEFRKEPPKVNVIEVPPIEPAIIEDYEGDMPRDVTPTDFIKAQLQVIGQQKPESKQKPVSGIHATLVDLPDEFDSPEDFVRFRQEYDAVLQKRSEDMGLIDKVKICQIPTCISPTVPSFDYCIYHLPHDSQFTKQYLITTCSDIGPDGKPCMTPTTVGLGKCAHHLQKIFRT